VGERTNLEIKRLLESQVSSDGDDGEKSSNGDLDGLVGVGLFWFGEGKEVDGSNVLSLRGGGHEDEKSLVDGLGDEGSEGGLGGKERGVSQSNASPSLSLSSPRRLEGKKREERCSPSFGTE